MRTLATIVAVTLLTGCNSLHDINTDLLYDDPQRYGYREHDPCIRCGEGWIFLNIDQTVDEPK